MKTFSNQVDLTAYFEGFHAKAYKCPAGVLTIGYGETRPYGKPVDPNMVCTEEAAKEWLNTDLSNIFTKLFHGTFKGDLPWHQVAAISDYAYNCGLNAFPTLLKYLKERNMQMAPLEFLDGFKANGKPLMGLLLRRISNYHTFNTGEYVAFEKGDPIPQFYKAALLLKNGHNDAAVAMINRLKVES